MFDLSGNPLGTLGKGSLDGEVVPISPKACRSRPTARCSWPTTGASLAYDLERETWFRLGDASSAADRVVHVVQAANGEILAADFDGSRIVLLADTAALYTGLWVRVDRVNAEKFPEVLLDVTVETREGKPVVGLSIDNFVVTEGRFSVGSNPSPGSSVVPRSPTSRCSSSGRRAWTGSGPRPSAPRTSSTGW